MSDHGEDNGNKRSKSDEKAEISTDSNTAAEGKNVEGNNEKASTTAMQANKAEENAKKRIFVIQEIVSTELTYVERLRLVLEEIFTPLRNLKILDDGDVLNQFHGLELIYNLHSRHSIHGSTSQNLKFVDLFDELSDNVNIYSEYLANYEPAMQRRAQLLVANRKFADFVDKAEKERLMGQMLESFLILPVQRIPRYRLLLEQLIKYTPEDHPDYSTVKMTYDKICEMAAYNNEAIRARENRNKVMEIMMLIDPSTRVDLMANKSRRYIRDAPLLRQCRKRYKEFHFWLFNDELLYGEKGPLRGYALNRRLALHRCKLKHLEESDPEAKIAVVFESPQKSFKIKFK